jgi:hypothetical protein
MIKIGTVNGDVIEAGGVKNVTNNYYGSELADGQDMHLDKTDMPEILKTEEAEMIMEELVDAGILTEDWLPNGLSGSERGLVARAVCEHLKINEVWQVFGVLWDEKPETLRGYFNKALEQRKSLTFQEKLKNIIS